MHSQNPISPQEHKNSVANDLPSRSTTFKESIYSVLLGTAVGDSLGLPAEGLSSLKIKELGWADSPWKHRFFFGNGMISDDTEHTILVASALLESGGDTEIFTQKLAWKLRWWILPLPAGVGLATARGCFKLWLGFPPTKSGVFSAGNGPAMRVGIIGAVFPRDAEKRKALVRAATFITHRDPRALESAMIVAEVVAKFSRNEAFEIQFLRESNLVNSEEWVSIITLIETELASKTSVADFAKQLPFCSKRGISGFAPSTVGAALYALLRHPNSFQVGMESLLNCGGDADTVGAIYGAMAGARDGAASIPQTWIDGLKDWPRGKKQLINLANLLNENESKPRFQWFWLGVIPRNLFFLFVVLVHGFLRLIPRKA